MKTRFISLLLLVALLLSCLPSAALAAQEPAFSGTCSDTVTWKFDPVEGVLAIEGTGPIPDYTYSDGAPWYALRSRIFFVTLSEGITAIGDFAFQSCGHLRKLSAADATLTRIGAGAFEDCCQLTTMEYRLADAIAVGADAFANCIDLTAIDLSTKSGTIGANAFEGCIALAQIKLPESLPRLERETFLGCLDLAEINIPGDLAYIGKYCFSGCDKLTELSFPATLAEVERSAFSSASLTLTFAGDAPKLAPVSNTASFWGETLLRVPYGTEGWGWPIFKGYDVEWIFPSLDDAFVDLVKDAWYTPYVQHVYYTGLMNGNDATHFIPTRSMTRGQLVTVLYRMAGSPEVTGENPFVDVAASAYYYAPVLWAQESGVVTGLTATTFGPGKSVTRQQVCTILYRYASQLSLDLTDRDPLTSFADAAQLADYARDPVSWCVAMGFINGKPGGLLDPLGTATRVEIAKILTVFDTYLARQEILDADRWADAYTDPDSTLDVDREAPAYLYAREIFDAINKKRTDAGLTELRWSDRVYLASLVRAEELTKENGFGHTRPDGTSYATVFEQFGIKSTTRNEIVAHGYTTAQSLVDVWASAGSTSPVISALVYSSGAVGVYQLPPEEGETEGKYYYALLVVG